MIGYCASASAAVRIACSLSLWSRKSASAKIAISSSCEESWITCHDIQVIFLESMGIHPGIGQGRCSRFVLSLRAIMWLNQDPAA
jgi:hypothetical protein